MIDGLYIWRHPYTRIVRVKQDLYKEIYCMFPDHHECCIKTGHSHYLCLGWELITEEEFRYILLEHL